MKDDAQVMNLLAKYSSQLMQDSRDGNNLATLTLTYYHKYQENHSSEARQGMVTNLNKWLETQ